ncbi:MAG: hypothetical protein AAFV32_07040 [Myxococcota bacterium]
METIAPAAMTAAETTVAVATRVCAASFRPGLRRNPCFFDPKPAYRSCLHGANGRTAIDFLTYALMERWRLDDSPFSPEGSLKHQIGSAVSSLLPSTSNPVQAEEQLVRFIDTTFRPTALTPNRHRTSATCPVSRRATRCRLGQ